MGKPKGLPPTGGRPKGSRNVATILREKKLHNGEMPWEYLLTRMRNKKVPHQRREQIAISLLPYCMARVSPLPPEEQPLNPDNVPQISMFEAARTIAFMLYGADMEMKDMAAQQVIDQRKQP